MESHILNTYHQARFRPIGHEILRMKSDSLSSESSYIQNSPEYPQISVPQSRHSLDSNNGDWGQNQTINITQSSHDTSSDDESSGPEESMEYLEENRVPENAENSGEELEEAIYVQEINVDDDDDDSVEVDEVDRDVMHSNSHHNIQITGSNSMEDNSLVEGRDYDVITVYTVDPDLVEISSDDDIETTDYVISEKDLEAECINGDDTTYREVNYEELEEAIYVQEINVDDDDDDNVEVDRDVMHSNSHHNIQITGSNSIEDNSLVEGHDYDVYTVDPDLVEISSDDDIETTDYVISEKDLEAECINGDDTSYRDVNYQERSTISQDGLDINLDTQVVSNVDEYFIKNNNERLLDTDGPVVKDTTPEPNIDDFFIKYMLPDEESIQFHIPVATSNVDEFLITDIKKDVIEEKTDIENEPDNDQVNDQDTTDNADVSINESDLEVLPNIEELERYLLEDMTYTKFRHIQKSCSIPQSPMQNICMDIDDVKTCMSFEDLNLDLSDLAFDNDKDKSENANKSDDVPRTLTEEDVNSFLITNNKIDPKPEPEEDALSHQDMEIERPLEATIETALPIVNFPPLRRTITPIPTVIDFCIEKTAITAIKKEIKADSKGELEDFVDVESCNDTVIPVLEANNLNSLLEQFEPTEKLSTKKKVVAVVKTEDPKIKSFNKNALTNGMRLQDAGVQLNKNKMRQILMPTPMNTTVRRSQSPVHSDQHYCSSKKRHSLPNLKGGQSLLKPEVLSSNSRLLNSRHRSCKSKKVVYHLSSDEETDNNTKNKKVKKNNSVKPSVKPPVQSNCRKQLSLPHSAPDSFKKKSDNSVMIKSASKSQNSNGSIKLTIKNKSQVILNCDHVDFQNDKSIDKCKNSVSDKTNNVEKQVKTIKELDRSEGKVVNNVETVTVKEEPRPKNENFYTALFNNKQDVQIPQALQPKREKRPFDDDLNKCMLEAAQKKEVDQPLKKKKIKLQEYKLRRGVCSNNSSATVSPEAIFSDMPSPLLDKVVKCPITQTPANGLLNPLDKMNNEQTFFDPIKEASRKFLMNTKKRKAEAMRKRDEDIVMSKLSKVQNLQLQPLISDAEMMKIVGMNQPEFLPVPLKKPQLSADYEKIILVSIGTNTDEKMFSHVEAPTVEKIIKSTFPTAESKSTINFKIKKSDHVLKQNLFDNVKRDKRSPVDEKKHSDIKIDKERYKDITATLKSVGKQVETKILSNSLFSSIQDVVLKKAPEEARKHDERHKLKSPQEKRDCRFAKTTIVREYDPKAEHGEDKVILHLGKHRCKPSITNMVMQTDPVAEFAELPILAPMPKERPSLVSRKRNDSDMSLSSDDSPTRKSDERQVKQTKPEDRVSKPKEVRTERTEAKDKRSRSKDRYDSKYRRRSRSLSRGRRRRSRSRTRSRSRSRSRGCYRRYRRSDSPYKRKRRSRSPYHKRRSPSIRRDRSIRSRSRSRPTETRSKSPVAKKTRPSPHTNGNDRKIAKSMTPSLRKPTVSESSDSSSRENNSFVEERRIVFVGRLEKDATKQTLRNQFAKFGPVTEVRLLIKGNGYRYGFVTYQRARDAWSAVEASSTFPQYVVGFGGRRAFYRQSYADLDGLDVKYAESAYHAEPVPQPNRRDEDMSFEQMLSEMKKKLGQRKKERKS